jgi:hypothetical protein
MHKIGEIITKYAPIAAILNPATESNDVCLTKKMT